GPAHDGRVHDMIERIIYDRYVSIPDQAGASRNISEFGIAQGIMVYVPSVDVAQRFIGNKIQYVFFKSQLKTSLLYYRFSNRLTNRAQNFFPAIPEPDLRSFGNRQYCSFFLL